MQKKGWGFLISLFPGLCWALNSQEHVDPLASILWSVTLILSLALMGRYFARLTKQPAVLGELLIGMIAGNLCYALGFQLIVLLREGSSIYNIMRGLLTNTSLDQAVNSSVSNPFYAQQVLKVLSSSSGTEYLKIAYVLDIFSRYGVIFLLFMVGLESSIKDLKNTGWESIRVAVLGMIAPMLLGFGVAYFLMPSESYSSDLFIAATLSATSIGITARVLMEMNKLKTREAHTILGAAMIDDILGLILLAVVSGVVVNGLVDVWVVTRIILYSLLFFIGVLWLGPIILHKAVRLFSRFNGWEAKLFISFLFIMILAWLASIIQLAPIIGAFAAGIIIHDDYFKPNSLEVKENSPSIQHLVAPLESILAPMFFVLIGLQVKLETFYNGQVIILALGLVIAAILGKLLSGLGAKKSSDRLLIGIGMLPRGEVGLVFASIGRTLGVISDNLFSAIVLMVLITTFIAPPLLKLRYTHKEKEIR